MLGAIRVRLVVILLLGVALSLLLGNLLWQQWNVNWNWLAAKNQMAQRGYENVCPEIALKDPATWTGALGSSARLQPLGALYLYAQRQPALAVQAYAALGDNTSRTDLFWYGCAAWANKDSTLAIQVWQKAGALDYFVNQGARQMRQHAPAQARPFFEIATLVGPDSAEAWIGLAQSEFDLAVGRKLEWEIARQSAERALVLAPGNARPHYLVGANLWRSNTDLTRAERELRLALDAHGGWLERYALAGLLIDTGKRTEPARLLEQVLQEQDTQAVRLQLVRAQIADGECGKAMETQHNALAKYPEMQDDFDTLCKRSTVCPCANNP